MGLKDKSILIIDDDPSICFVLEKILTNMGMLVYTQNSILKAEEALNSFQPDLILIEIHLADTSGLELLAKNKRNSKFGMPILLMSSGKKEALFNEAFHLSAFDYIEKPIEPQILIQKIRRALGSSEYIQISFSVDQMPQIRLEIPATITAAIDQGFQLESSIRLGVKSSAFLISSSLDQLGLNSEINIRTSDYISPMLRRGSFLNSIRIPGLDEDKILRFKKIIKSWHTK